MGQIRNLSLGPLKKVPNVAQLIVAEAGHESKLIWFQNAVKNHFDSTAAPSAESWAHVMHQAGWANLGSSLFLSALLLPTVPCNLLVLGQS